MSYFQNRGTVFFFNPTGGQSPAENFYNTWVDMMDAIAGVPGEKTICIDNSGTLIGSSVVPTGTYDLDKITLAGPLARVQTWAIQNGVIFENFRHMARNLTIDYEGTSQPLCTLSESITTNITVEDRCAAISSGGASQPVWQLEGSIAYNFNLFGTSRLGSFATTQDTVKTAGAAVVLNLFLDGQSNIPDAQTLEGDGTDTLNVTFRDALSSAPDFSAEGFGTVTVTDSGASDSIAYDNTTSGLTGENVQDAIDDLGMREEFDSASDITLTGNNLTIDNDANNAVSISLDSGFDATQSSNLVFRDQGVNKWAWIKNGSNDFILQDSAESTIPIRVQTHADNDDSIYINSGNVGIGDAPDASTKLHVKGNTAKFEAESGAFNLIVEGATGQAADVRFRQAGTDEWIWRLDGATNFVLKNSANDNIIGIINGVTTEAIRIDSAGEVGINNTTPQRQLDVTGTMRSSGNLDVGATATNNSQPAVKLVRDGDDDWLIYSAITSGHFVIANILGTDTFPFIIHDNAPNTLFTLHTDGVGINKGTPTRSLDVTGGGAFSSLLEADGGIDISGARVNSLGVTSTGTNLTVTTEDLVACTAGSITITLPAVASAGVGRSITIKDRDGNAGSGDITIDGNASETIDGATTFVMNIDYQSTTLVNDGSTWMIV